MIAWLVGLGLSPRGAKILLIVGGALLLIAAFTVTLHAYGSAQYKAGKKDADAAWIAASNKLIQKAQDAGTKASEKQAAATADFAAKQETERKAIENAQANGTSPFDALFGNGS